MKVVLQTGKTVLPKEKQGGGGNEIQSLGTRQMRDVTVGKK